MPGLNAMQLTLTENVRITSSLLCISQKPGEIPIFRTFLVKYSIFAYISLKMGYFESGDDYNVTVTSYLGCWYVWKEETPSFTLWYGTNYMYLGISFSSSPLGKTCYKKGLVRQGLKGLDA